jgi:hypothetical protein
MTGGTSCGVGVGVGVGVSAGSVRVGLAVHVGVAVAATVGVDVGGGAARMASGLTFLPVNARYTVYGSAEATIIVDSSKPTAASAVTLCLAFMCYLRGPRSMAAEDSCRQRICLPAGSRPALALTST